MTELLITSTISQSHYVIVTDAYAQATRGGIVASVRFWQNLTWIPVKMPTIV